MYGKKHYYFPVVREKLFQFGALNQNINTITILKCKPHLPQNRILGTSDNCELNFTVQDNYELNFSEWLWANFNAFPLKIDHLKGQLSFIPVIFKHGIIIG